MKNLKIISLFFFLFGLSTLTAATLLEVYQQAQPGLGYDKLVMLEPDSIYTGGISITNQKVGIKGRGAIINLNGGSIIVSGESQIEVDGCVVINGGNGIYASGNVSCLVSQCTFYGNNVGIHFLSATGMVTVVNTIFSNNTQYGFACDQNSYRVLHYLDAYQNAQGNYKEWCSG
jgi:parallel beta-helix repeat protein